MLPFDPALPLLTLRSCAGIGTPCGGPYELSAKGAMARECLEEIYGWFSDPNNEIVSTELDDASPPENVDFIYMELS